MHDDADDAGAGQAGKDRRGRPGAESGGVRVAGRILESMPNALYRVELESEGRPQVTAHLSVPAGRMRLLPGQAVEVELSPYDRSRGRIVGKHSGV